MDAHSLSVVVTSCTRGSSVGMTVSFWLHEHAHTHTHIHTHTHNGRVKTRVQSRQKGHVYLQRHVPPCNNCGGGAKVTAQGQRHDFD